MAYALGLELTNAGVVASVANHVADSQTVTTVPPLLVVIDGNVSAGQHAASLMDDNPTAVVNDIVGQFSADRLWFVGGMMLTPDDAMRSLLSAVVAEVEVSKGERAGATTVSCPAVWEEPSRQRVTAIVESLGLPQAEVVFGVDASGAAAHAALRLADVTRPAVDASAAELPPTMASVARPAAPSRGDAQALPVPQRVVPKRRAARHIERSTQAETGTLLHRFQQHLPHAPRRARDGNLQHSRIGFVRSLGRVTHDGSSGGNSRVVDVGGATGTGGGGFAGTGSALICSSLSARLIAIAGSPVRATEATNSRSVGSSAASIWASLSPSKVSTTSRRCGSLPGRSSVKM